jgi:prophage tail gpP-like protein
VSKSANRDTGVVYKISGRDFLGPVVSASVDPKTRIASNQTVSDFLAGVLAPFGLSKIYMGDIEDMSIITGYAHGRGGAQTRTSVVKEVTGRTPVNSTRAELTYTSKTVTQVISYDRPDLKKIPLDQLKPKLGDGAMQVIERLLSRLSLVMWAAADGSGVIVDRPRFDREPVHRLVRKFDGGDENNILDGTKDVNGEVQPSCVVAVGQSSGADMAKTRLKCVAVNELVAVYPGGALAPSVLATIANYPGIRVLPLREQLIPPTDRIVGRRKPVPMFVKDDESKTLEQLVAFARRKLAEKQRAYLSVTYSVKGHAYDGRFPWAVNTMVDVDDDFLGVHEPLWCMSRTFSKSRRGGTTTEVRLIKPYTLELGT